MGEKYPPQRKHAQFRESVTAAARVVIGYDDERRVMIVHDPSFGPAWEIGYEDFENMWRYNEFIFLACLLFVSSQPGQAHATRIKDALEKYELSTLKFVHFGKNKPCGDYALVVDAEGYGYTVRVGNLIGRKFGRIVEIKEDRMLIMELVQDQKGEWVEKPAHLSRKASAQK